MTGTGSRKKGMKKAMAIKTETRTEVINQGGLSLLPLLSSLDH